MSMQLRQMLTAALVGGLVHRHELNLATIQAASRVEGSDDANAKVLEMTFATVTMDSKMLESRTHLTVVMWG